MITHIHRCSIGIRCIPFVSMIFLKLHPFDAMRCDSLGIMSIAQMNHFNESINLLLAFKCFELNLWLFLPLSIFDFRYDYPSFESGVVSACTMYMYMCTPLSACTHCTNVSNEHFLSFPLCTPVLWLLILVLCVRVLLQLNITILFLLVSISTQFYTSRSAVRVFCFWYSHSRRFSLSSQNIEAFVSKFSVFFLPKWHSSSHTE